MKTKKGVFPPLFHGILDRNVVTALGFGIPLVVGTSINLRMGTVVCILMLAVNLLVGTAVSMSPIQQRMKAPVATICSMLLIALLWQYLSYFSKELTDMGFYITLIAVNSILIENLDFDVEQGVLGKVGHLFSQTLGFSLIILILSMMRELMGRGSLWGITIIEGMKPFYFIPTQSVFMGFLLLALLISLLRLGKRGFVAYTERSVKNG